MTIQSTTSSLNPDWNIMDLWEKREVKIQELTQGKEAQESDFEKNYQTVAKQIAESFGEHTFQTITKAILNPRTPVFKFTFYMNFILSLDPLSQNDRDIWETFKSFAKETAKLPPFCDWAKKIHYYTDSEISEHSDQSVQMKHAGKIKLAVIPHLERIFLEYQKLNSSWSFSLVKDRKGIVMFEHEINIKKLQQDIANKREIKKAQLSIQEEKAPLLARQKATIQDTKLKQQ